MHQEKGKKKFTAVRNLQMKKGGNPIRKAPYSRSSGKRRKKETGKTFSQGGKKSKGKHPFWKEGEGAASTTSVKDIPGFPSRIQERKRS